MVRRGRRFESAKGLCKNPKPWPYHLHHANEAWLAVLRGRATLWTPEGERALVKGDVTANDRPEIQRFMREIVRSPTHEGKLRPATHAKATCCPTDQHPELR
jgi:hypothetical protein